MRQLRQRPARLVALLVAVVVALVGAALVDGLVDGLVRQPAGSSASSRASAGSSLGSGGAASRSPGGVTAQLPHRGVPPGRLDRSDGVGAAIAAGRLLFVGASYSVGWGATASDDRYEDVVAHDLHRRFSVNAVAGTGFLDPGPHHEGTFAQRLQRIPTRADPRIVVLQGGRDDQAYPPAQEYRAAVRTIELAQHRFTHAQVVVLGPIPAHVPVPPRELAINAALVRACRTARAGYVDAIAQGWIDAGDERGYLGAIPDHPDDAGYAFIGRHLVADLPAALRTARLPLDPSDEPSPSGPPGT